MAAGTWKIYAKAKKYMAAGTIVLTSGGVFKMQLHRAGASAAILALSTRSTSASIGSEISATGGYAAGGRAIPAIKWTVGASAKQYKFSYTTAGLIFTASGADLGNASTLARIKYAIIRNSTSSGGGKLLCFCTLSSTAFAVTSGNTLTITPNASGVFTLA